MTLEHRFHALSQSARLRFSVLFIVLLAQGFPLGLFFTAVPIWLAASGASPASIGLLISAATLPWTFKFFSGPMMDRYTFLSMGKRRPWLIGSQSLIVLALVIGASLNPDGSELLTLAAIAFSVNAFARFKTRRLAVSRSTWCQKMSARARMGSYSPERPLGRRSEPSQVVS